MNYKNENRASIGKYPLIINNIIDEKNKDDNMLNFEQERKLEELRKHISTVNDKIIGSNYLKTIMESYITFINDNRTTLIKKINSNELYSFFKFNGNSYVLTEMKDYWDIDETEKLFSFSLFITNHENLTYLIGLVYNYAIIKKHFREYKMRLYIDFHSVFGSAETFNVFNMFTDILKTIDPEYNNTLQMIVFFINPFFNVDKNDLFSTLVTDINEVKKYYISVLYNDGTVTYIKSPLLTSVVDYGSNTFDTTNTPKKDISVDIDNLEVTYTNIEDIVHKSTFNLLSCHISVNLRFLPMNENCEFHVRDLDSRLSLTDKNIINKFNNPKYQYAPYYVFQFYKFYFPYLKWRIDVNPYLAGCFGGNNRKAVMISKELLENQNMKILKKELFFKYILFISLNASNLQIGFLNDEFILANIFEKIKGKYSENILYLNLGSFANKHVNEYYYGLSNNSNYPCILKLGVPIDILRYPLNGKYLTVDPITDFKMGTIPMKYHFVIKNMITEQLKIYLGFISKEKVKISNKIRLNYKTRLDQAVNNDLEAALFFSMLPKKYVMEGIPEFNSSTYTSNSYNNQIFSTSMSVNNGEELKAINFMMAGYLLADVLEDIIFPINPEYINSNYYLSEDNYDRLFNCLYFDETKKMFAHRKINKTDVSRKYINQDIIDHIPEKYLEFKNKNTILKEINSEFNVYLETCKYFVSMNNYISNIYFNEWIQVGSSLIKSGTLIFIKDYSSIVNDKFNNVVTNVLPFNVSTLKYTINQEKDTIDGINVIGNKLRFNLLLVDDQEFHQMTYKNTNIKSKICAKLLKSNHLENLSNLMKQNKYNDFLVINKF